MFGPQYFVIAPIGEECGPAQKPKTLSFVRPLNRVPRGFWGKKMAARRSLQFCSRSGLFRQTKVASEAANATSFGVSPSKPASACRFSLRNRASSRIPVELGGALTLVPLHNATASALFTSLLSLHNNKWGCLSEGFATPL